MLCINDYCLLYKSIFPELDLPLVMVNSTDSIVSIVSDRNGWEKTVETNELLKLDQSYADPLWDELITLEKQILFIRQCLGSPIEFRIYKGVLIKRVDKNKIVSMRDLNTESVFDFARADILNEARLSQFGEKLLKLEEEHDFVMSALDFLN